MIRLIKVRIAREDERADAHGVVGFKLGQHLVGRADDGRPAARARAPYPGPHMRLDIAVLVGVISVLGLMADPQRLGVQRPVADRLPLRLVELRDDVVGVFAGFGLRVADDHVGAQAIIEGAVVALGHLVDRPHPPLQRFDSLGPHQIDITVLPAELERIGRVPPEVQQRPARLVGPHRIGGQTFELVDLALMVDLIPGPGLLEDFHHFTRALVAEWAGLSLTGKVRRDDVDGQSAFEHVVEGRHRPREHDRLHLPAAHGREQVDPIGDGRAARDKRERILPDLIGRRAEDIAEALRFRGLYDIRAVRPT